MTLDLGAVSDLRPLLKTRHHLHIMWACGVRQVIFSLLMFDGEDGVAEDDGDVSLLLTLFFLLYHICHHSFLKSCYLKKCFNFCVLSLFCFFKAFKWAEVGHLLSSWNSRRHIFKKWGRSLTSGLQRETCRNADSSEWSIAACLPIHWLYIIHPWW